MILPSPPPPSPNGINNEDSFIVTLILNWCKHGKHKQFSGPDKLPGLSRNGPARENGGNRGLACVARQFWLGAFSNINKGGRGQRNSEKIGAGATWFLFMSRLRRSFSRLRCSCARLDETAMLRRLIEARPTYPRFAHKITGCPDVVCVNILIFTWTKWDESLKLPWTRIVQKSKYNKTKLSLTERLLLLAG